MDAIVAAARRVLETEGFDNLTMQRVADEVGVRPPSLYKHVRDRGDLVHLVANDVARELADTMDAAASTGDPKSDLRALAEAFRTFWRRFPGVHDVWFRQQPDSWRADPELARRVNDAMLRTCEALVGPEQRLDASRTIVAFVNGYMSMELGRAFRMGGDPESAWEFGITRLVEAIANERRVRRR